MQATAYIKNISCISKIKALMDAFNKIMQNIYYNYKIPNSKY